MDPLYTDEQKKTFDDLVENYEALKLYCFSLSVHDQVWYELFNSFPKGLKMQGKAKANELCSAGCAKFYDICDEIDNLAECHDVSVSEVFYPLDDFEKEMIMQGLKLETIEFLKNLPE